MDINLLPTSYQHKKYKYIITILIVVIIILCWQYYVFRSNLNSKLNALNNEIKETLYIEALKVNQSTPKVPLSKFLLEIQRKGVEINILSIKITENILLINGEAADFINISTFTRAISEHSMVHRLEIDYIEDISLNSYRQDNWENDKVERLNNKVNFQLVVVLDSN